MRHPALLLFGLLVVTALLITWFAQETDPAFSNSPATTATAPPKPDRELVPAPAELPLVNHPLPAFLLRVGSESKPNVVPMGISAAYAIELAETFYPYNEKLALHLLRNISSELGARDIEVDSFLLSKYPVTNEQYLRYIQATGERFPYHWWRSGKTEHFEATKEKVRKAYPDLPSGERGNAPLYYWEFNWKSQALPYAIPPGAEKLPGIFVSWNDAMRYAAWAGMRLPSEPEWTLAAKGDKRVEFVFGEKWYPEVLRDLGMENMRDIKLKPVGALGPKAVGPFGHLDMVGQVWEWVIPLGYEPQTSRALFDKEYELLRRDQKYGKRIKAKPNFKSGAAIAKGGSFYTFSNQDFIQTRVGCRAPLSPVQTLECLGFRVARTRRAAYDMSLTRLKIDYPDFMPGNVDWHLSRQVGIERYELEDSGEIIKNYHAVSAIPITFLATKSGLDTLRLKESFMTNPALISILITTEEILTPALQPGLYGVYYRPAGIPSILQGALRQGHRELLATAQGYRLDPASKWLAVVRGFGYSMTEIEEKDVSELSKYVYVLHTGLEEREDGKRVDKRFKITTEKPLILFRSQSGEWLAAIDSDVTLDRPVTQPTRSAITVARGDEVEFTFGVTQDHKEFKTTRHGRELPFCVRITLRNPWH